MKMKIPAKTGPVPERVNLDVPWEQAIGSALKKKRPKDGWPKPEKDKAGKKKG